MYNKTKDLSRFANLCSASRYPHAKEQKRPRGGAIFTLFRAFFSASLLVDGLEREELEVVLLIEPATLEDLQRKRSSSRQGECVDRELDVGMRFFSSLRLVVKNVDVTIADLQEVDVAGDNGAVEFKAETSASVVADVVLSKEHRYFHGERDGVIDEHETLKCLVAFLVVQ